jgi:tetratricopeptide (TPR) repeat protein
MEFHSIYLETIRQNFYLCKFSQAEKAIVEHLADHPDDFISHMNLYFVYLAMEKFDDAKKHFQKAIALNPNAFFELGNGGILNFTYVANHLTQEEKNKLNSVL